MRNKMHDLRNHLFEVIEALKDEDKPMDLDRAKVIREVADSLIKSAKVEVDFQRVAGDYGVKSEFLEAQRPRLVSGK